MIPRSQGIPGYCSVGVVLDLELEVLLRRKCIVLVAVTQCCRAYMVFIWAEKTIVRKEEVNAILSVHLINYHDIINFINGDTLSAC